MRRVVWVRFAVFCFPPARFFAPAAAFETSPVQGKISQNQQFFQKETGKIFHG
jgi:hypothetical protein